MGTRRFDPHDDTVVLKYTGEGLPIAGVPARDLTANELCRIAHRRAMAAYEPLEKGSVRPDPLKPSQKAVNDLVDELLERSFARAARPKAPPTKKPTKRPVAKTAKAAPPVAAEAPAAPVEG